MLKNPLVLLLFFEEQSTEEERLVIMSDLGEIHGYVRGEDIGGVTEDYNI